VIVMARMMTFPDLVQRRLLYWYDVWHPSRRACRLPE
jgi:hypothetical protein